MHQPASTYDDPWPRAAPSNHLGRESAANKAPCQQRLHGSDWARLVIIPLFAQLLGAGCSLYEWTPIEPGFANGKTRKLDKVRIDGVTYDGDTSITGPLVTVYQGQSTLVSLDLQKDPKRVDVTWYDVTAIAKGQRYSVDSLRVGDDILTQATIVWPIITGFKKTPLTVDVRTKLVQRQKVRPGPAAAAIILPILGGILLLTLGVYGLAAAGGSACGHSGGCG